MSNTHIKFLERAADEKAYIIEACDIDRCTPEQLEESASGPGKYEGNSDRLLAVALHLLSLDQSYVDDSEGDVDSYGHCARIGRFLIWTSTNGFVDVETYDNEAMAQDTLERFRAEFYSSEDNEDGE